MVSFTSEYISVGGNRHPAAADWDVQSGILAYGADNNVALWDPLVRGSEVYYTSILPA
jgi:elongator complex protein 2